MKKTFWMMCMVPFVATLAFAGVTEGQGHWSGKGVEFNAQGNAVAPFSLTMESNAQGDHKLVSNIKIDEEGQTWNATQTLIDGGDNGFSIESTQGNGGGYYFGQGLAEAYVGTQEEGFAITIVLDNPDQRRFLVTHLKKGVAVGFIRETVDRESK